MKSTIHENKKSKLQILSKTQIKKLAALVALVFAFSSCGDNNDQNPQNPTPCNTVGTDFQNLYQAVLISNTMYDNYVTMDLLTHEYTFTVNTAKTICTVGYQGNANLYAASKPYTIEIYNNTTSTMVYSGTHLFNSASTDYQPITPTALVVGNRYTIRRILPPTGYLGLLGNTIGRICRKNQGPNQFPATNGAMTILSSNFYGTGGPAVDFGIPYIDIVFQ